MHGEIRRLKGNLRYRILNINEDYYLIDTGASPWKAIAPFFFLLFRNPGYKIDKETALNLITNQKAKPGKGAMYGAIGAGIAITFNEFLTSITDRLNINSSIQANSITTLISVVLICLTFLFILKKLKQNIEKTINYTELPKQEMKIYLPNSSHIIKISFFSLFAATVSVTFLLGFIHSSNIFILSMGLVMLLVFLLLGGIALDHGKYKVK
jgi:uncharacterized membrane protein (TIGR01218 family)